MFINRLNIKLTMKMAGKTHEVPAGNIKNLELRLRSYGFEAELDFWLVSQKSESEDKLYADFIKDDLITVKLTVDRTFDKVGSETDTLEINGLVEHKTLGERAFHDLAGAPVLHRHYLIKFRDRAAVLWSQHRPVQVFAEQTLKKVIDDHKPAGLTLTHDWSASGTKYPVLSVGVGADPDASNFYDYLAWLGEQNGIGLFMDLKTGKYTLSDKKPAVKANIPLPEGDIELLNVEFPPTPRHAVRVLNGYSEAGTKQKDVANKQAVAKVRQDRLLIAPVASDVTNRTKAEKTGLVAPDPELRIIFDRYPSVTLRPNLVYNFSDGWSDRVHHRKGKFRTCSVDIIAHAENQGATDDSDNDSNTYEIEVTAHLEPKASKRFAQPPHRRPHWPFYVEGKIVSEVGKKEELTYQATKNKKTSLEFYTVLIPLWNQKVIVPYNPGQFSGHFYFPAYKDERVLLAIDHDRAWIKRFLDWRPGARLPAEGQGNHLLLGKKDADQTSIRHVYDDAKPVLTIERTMAKDTQVIEVSEGTIFLRTKEED